MGISSCSVPKAQRKVGKRKRKRGRTGRQQNKLVSRRALLVRSDGLTRMRCTRNMARKKGAGQQAVGSLLLMSGLSSSSPRCSSLRKISRLIHLPLPLRLQMHRRFPFDSSHTPLSRPSLPFRLPLPLSSIHQTPPQALPHQNAGQSTHREGRLRRDMSYMQQMPMPRICYLNLPLQLPLP